MADKKTAGVRLSGAFPAGTKVQLFERRGDVFSEALPVAGKGTVDANSEVSFEKLEEGAQFWVAGEVDGVVRERAVTAKQRVGGKARDSRSQAQRLKEAPAQRFQTDHGVTVSGTRTTIDAGRLRGHVKHTDAPALAQDPIDTNRQDGGRALGDPEAPEVLASDTALGQAVAADPGRLQQEDVPEGVVQASSTEFGDAAPIQALPQQSDVPKGAVQASATAEGAATVLPHDDHAGAVLPDDLPDKPDFLTVQMAGELTNPEHQKRVVAGHKAAQTRKRHEAAERREAAAAKKAADTAAAAKRRSAASRKAARTRARNKARADRAARAKPAKKKA